MLYVDNGRILTSAGAAAGLDLCLHMVGRDLGAEIAAQTGGQIQVLNCLDRAGHLCAATGRHAEAVTVWAAYAALLRHGGFTEPPVGD